MQNNERLVKDFYDSVKNKDQVYRSFCQDNIEWITMDGMPNGGRYVGLKSVFEEYFCFVARLFFQLLFNHS